MKHISMIAALFLMLIASLPAFATTDGIYGLNQQQSYTWDGTTASRLAATGTDYNFAYGDEATVTHTLPWSFSFYGQPYNQITAGTNGNIWFGTTGSAHSFNLTTNGKGPVIAAWNSDQSSYYNGGVFIQHKTDAPMGERVVIEWQGETYTEEGLTIQPNNFEVVLFPNGDIRIDYKSFTAANAKDFGSGISNNDGHSLAISNITGAFVPVYQLAGNSYGFIAPKSVQVSFSGTGNGIVTSSPAGIACNTNCSSIFPANSQVSLHPVADQYSLFTGWFNGACSGLADCLLTLNTNALVTAGFDKNTAHQVYLPGGSPEYYASIQAAYNVAASGSTIKLWATDYNESLICNKPTTVTLQGGYDSGYSTITGNVVLQGTLTISDGLVIADGITIR